MGDGELQKGQAYRGTVAILLLYKLVMDLFYTCYISKVWERKQWWFINPNFEGSVVGWIVYAAILLLFMPVLKKSFSAYMFSDYVLFFPAISFGCSGTWYLQRRDFPKAIYRLVLYVLAFNVPFAPGFLFCQ